MKIFYAVQLANTTITKSGTHLWKIDADACMIMCRGIVESLLAVDPTLEFLIKVPYNIDCTSYAESLFSVEALRSKRIAFIQDKKPVHPTYARFSFNFDEYLQYRPLFRDIDVMINDETTLTKNWKVFFSAIGKKIPIVSIEHFLDYGPVTKVPKGISYIERQIESMDHSDMIASESVTRQQEMINAYNWYFNSDNPLLSESIEDKFVLWTIGADRKEVDSKKVEYSARSKVTTIYFTNRITETVERYTNWHVFAEAIGILQKISKLKFQAIMTNPTQKATQAQIDEIDLLSNGVVTVFKQSLSREEYLEFINKAHISCNLYIHDEHGGISSYEAQMAGNIIVCPKIKNYLQRFQNAKVDYPFYCTKNEQQMSIDPHTLAHTLRDILALPEFELEEWSKINREVAYAEDYGAAGPKILADLKRVAKL